MPEQSIRGPVPDVLTLTLAPGCGELTGTSPGLAVVAAPTATRLVRRAEESEEMVYVRKEDFELPADQRLTHAAYDAGPPAVSYVEPVAVGQALPEMPLFLKPEFYVPAPLEDTYRTTWNDFFPAPLKGLLETTE